MNGWRRLRDALSGGSRSVDFDALPIALIHLDGAGLIRQANRGWEQLSGYRLRDCQQASTASFCISRIAPYGSLVCTACGMGTHPGWAACAT